MNLKPPEKNIGASVSTFLSEGGAQAGTWVSRSEFIVSFLAFAEGMDALRSLLAWVSATVGFAELPAFRGLGFRVSGLAFRALRLGLRVPA